MARRKHAPQHALDVDAHKRALGEDMPDKRCGELDRRLGEPRTIREDDGGFLRKERLLDGLVERNGNSAPRLHRRLDEGLGILGYVIAKLDLGLRHGGSGRRIITQQGKHHAQMAIEMQRPKGLAYLLRGITRKVNIVK